MRTTRAIVLRTIRHRDHALILKAYTEAFGTRTYLVRTKKQGNGGMAPLQPLARLELVVHEDGEREINTVREVRVDRPYIGIPHDPNRAILLLFAQEVFLRTLKEEAPDKALFAFVSAILEEIDTGIRLGELPLTFLVGLARQLGILPEPPRPGEDRFDLQEGRFFKGQPAHGLYMDEPTSRAFGDLLLAEAENRDSRTATGLRKNLLDQLLTYYGMHVDGFGQLKSVAVLHALLN